jgi:hypothetical protein
MIFGFFRSIRFRDYVVGLVIVLLTAVAPLLWVGIIHYWIVLLIVKLGMNLVPAWRARPSASLGRMWGIPLIFLLMVPWYTYTWKATRAAGDQVVREIEQYHQTHGIYPPGEKDLNYKFREGITNLHYQYLAETKEPVLMYQDPLTRYVAFYHYDFDKKTWELRD